VNHSPKDATSHPIRLELWLLHLWKPQNSHWGCLLLWKSMHSPGYIVS
jgi:hypothetical protein